MIIRGTPIHRDGHGKCGLLTPAAHHCLTPFITSHFGFFQGLVRRLTKHLMFVNQAWPCVVQRSPGHDRSGKQMLWHLVTRL